MYRKILNYEGYYETDEQGGLFGNIIIKISNNTMISTEITRIQGAKTALKAAIEEKGVTVPQTAKIDDYADYVEEIEQGGGGSSYSYTTGKIRGLADLGWDEESIGSYNDNLGIYPWQSESVTDANKALYGVVNASNLKSYSGNTDMEYLPAFQFTATAGNYLYNFKYIKGVPKITFSGNKTTLVTFFSGCSSLIVAPNIDTSGITNMGSMFLNCSSLKTVPQYDTSRVTSMRSMFSNCSSLTNLPEINMSACTDSNGMFSSCKNLNAVKLLNTTNIKNTSSMFNTCNALESVDMDLSACTAATQMFMHCSRLKNANLTNTGNIANMDYMFYNCSGLTSINLDMSACTTADRMFNGCSGLTSMNLTNTGNITKMDYMFQNCRAMTEFPLFDTHNVTTMQHTFDQVSATTIPLYDTSNVTNMQYMFSSSKITTIPALNTSSLINASYMFNACSGLTSLPELDFGAVTAMTYFFGSSGTMAVLTELGGFKNLKCQWNDNYGLARLNNLTVQSLLNVLNDLYDFTGHSETPTSSQGKLKLGSANYNKLTAEQIAIGTNKGWTITA